MPDVLVDHETEIDVLVEHEVDVVLEQSEPEEIIVTEAVQGPPGPPGPVGVATVLAPSATAAPANNGEMVFELTSDTSLAVKVRGSDGVVRSAVLTLA